MSAPVTGLPQPGLPPPTAVAAARRRPRPRARPRLRISFPLAMVYLTWAVVLCDPQWYLAAKGFPQIVLKLPLALFGVLALTLVASPPRRIPHPYLLLFLFAGTINIPFAYNIGYAQRFWQQVFLYCILAAATLRWVRTPQQAMPLILLFLWQHAWWGAHGGTRGLVRWHPTNGNFDGFGPQMVIGLAICYYFALAARSRRMRHIAYFLAGVCILGVVASFARGAVLAAGTVVLYAWWRSPRKGNATLGIMGAGLIVVIGSAALFPDNMFWEEMKSAFDEGTERGTGADRKELWLAAIKVWQDRPVFGVGWGNFGVWGAETFEVGDVGGRYAANPGRLYGRSTHSIFFQILPETGLFGATIFVLMLVDFWRRNAALRKPAFARKWARFGGHAFHLKPISLGFECAMIAYLTTGFFYAQLFSNWFFTLTIANLALYWAAKPAPAKRRVRRRLATG